MVSQKSHEQNTNTWVIIGLVLALLFFGVIGNYHIVTDYHKVFIPRPYYGFSDIIGAVEMCTTGPWISVSQSHGSLCKALQNEGVLETSEQMKTRTSNELKDKMETLQNCLDKCNFTDPDYSSCVSSCTAY